MRRPGVVSDWEKYPGQYEDELRKDCGSFAAVVGITHVEEVSGGVLVVYTIRIEDLEPVVAIRKRVDKQPPGKTSHWADGVIVPIDVAGGVGASIVTIVEDFSKKRP